VLCQKGIHTAIETIELDSMIGSQIQGAKINL
jgi:hypothetical protein